MFCDILNEEEIYQAYLLYASLHGFCTDEETVRERIESYYRRNVPDETIDDAIFSYAEDHIVAPPDIVLSRWGKSRVYELQALPCGGWRHQICESWFEAGCEFQDNASVRLAHFWTAIGVPGDQADHLQPGMRLQFRLENNIVQVAHRKLGVLAALPVALAAEILSRAKLEIRYLALIERMDIVGEQLLCKLFVTLAEPQVPSQEMLEYAANAFNTPRNKC